ncbi:MAG: alpha/beta hydrolase family protein [Tepidiformaceae bacterium]
MRNMEQEPGEESAPPAAVADGEAGAWAAIVRGPSTVFLRLSRTTAGELGPYVDLPAQLRFRIPLQRIAGGDDQAEFTASIEGLGQLTITGDPNGHQLGDEPRGRLQFASAAESLVLLRVEALDRGTFAPFIGTYSGAGRTLLLSMRGDDAAAVPFYLEGDAIVRLYPVGEGRFFSERCEELSLVRVDGAALTVRPPDGANQELLRIDACQERAVTFTSAGAELSGTLLLPHAGKHFGAVVLMHGSQPGERDFYRVYADSFVRAGMAALIFDKRGFGRSPSDRESSLLDRAHDAAAAVRYLRTVPEIDGTRVGLWAFSNGTWSAPMVAAGLEEVACLAALGAAGVSPAEAEIHRKLQELAEWGVSTALIEQARRAWTFAYAVVTGSSLSESEETEYHALVERLHAAPEVAGIPLADYAIANPWLAPIPPVTTPSELRELTGAASEMGYDPIADYARVRCPVLFLVGSDDPNVPGTEGAARVRAALAAARHNDYEVKVVDGAAHLLNIVDGPVTGMSVAEASGELHAFRFVPGHLDRVTDWIARQLSE